MQLLCDVAGATPDIQTMDEATQIDFSLDLFGQLIEDNRSRWLNQGRDEREYRQIWSKLNVGPLTERGEYTLNELEGLYSRQAVRNSLEYMCTRWHDRDWKDEASVLSYLIKMLQNKRDEAEGLHRERTAEDDYINKFTEFIRGRSNTLRRTAIVFDRMFSESDNR